MNSRKFHAQWLAAVLLVQGCNFKKEEIPRAESNPCHRINIQVSTWSNENAQTLVSCLVSDPHWAEKIELLDPARFQKTAAWLNDRPRLIQRAEQLSRIQPLWGEVFGAKKTHSILALTDLRSLLGFSQNVHGYWRDHFRHYQKDYEKLLDGIMKLELDRSERAELLQSVATVFRELPSGSKDRLVENWSSDLFHFMARLEKNPKVVHALALVSAHNNCSRLANASTVAIRTISPLELGVELFRDRDVTPESFVETFQQGFLFWESVCGGNPKIERHQVRDLLHMAVSNFDLLARISAIPWTQEAILALGRFLELGAISQRRGGPALLPLLLESRGLLELFSEMQKDPARGLRLSESLPQDKEVFLVFSELTQEPALYGSRLLTLWIESLDMLSSLAEDADVLAEWQEILAELGPEATAGFGAAISKGAFQKRMEYLIFLMNLKVARNNSVGPNAASEILLPPPARPVLPVAPDSYLLDRGHRMIDECLKEEQSVHEALSCIRREGAQSFPTSAKWLKNIHADWEPLYLLRKFPMKFLLNPKTANEFWKPLLDGLHLPFKNANKMIVWLDEGSQLDRADREMVLLLGRKLFEALTRVPETPKESPTTNRSINRENFRIKSALRKVDPTYFKSLIYSLIGDPSFLETRRSFYRLARTNVKVGDQELPIISAMNELIANFKLPFLSKLQSFNLAMSNGKELSSADDLRKWMAEQESLLARADWWLSFVYSSSSDLRKNILLAKNILHGLASKADIKDLWKIFQWFKRFEIQRGGNEDNLAFLLMIHEMGFFQSIQELYDSPPNWVLKGLHPTTAEEARALEGTSQWIADTLFALFESMSEEDLMDLAVLNMEVSNGKFLKWTMVELGDLIMNSRFSISDRCKKWIHSGIRQVGAPPLKSPREITPLVKFVRNHRDEFLQLFQPEIFELAHHLRIWPAYPELVDFLTSRERVKEWHELVDWLRSPYPIRLWEWSLRLERRILDPKAAENPLE